MAPILFGTPVRDILWPIGPDLVNVLTRYASQRKKDYSTQPDHPFFVSRTGSAIQPWAPDLIFSRLRRRAQVERHDGGRFQPRLHDMRHSFAVHRLISWYRQGADVQRLLPQLATYLGHVDVAATQRYLTMTPELRGKPASDLNTTPGGRERMNEAPSLGVWVRRFLLEHLVGERNLARNTQRSYRDTLVLFLPFVAAKLNKALDQLTPTDLSAEVVRLFLTHLEESRQSSIGTRNQRLAALHALARFVGGRSPEHIVWCGQIRAIPFKKTTQVVIPYLDKPEMDSLLAAPDRQTPQGQRDYALLLFLYNSGTRADEAAQLIVRDLHTDALFVRIVGKGRKERHCPLWRATVETLVPLIANRSPADRVFLNRCGHRITRFGIHAMVERYAEKARAKIPSLVNKQVSPHSIRHTTACHLLRAGVDINTIRSWLGHVSLDTTNIYAEMDLEMKAKALAMCEVAGEPKTNRPWRKEPRLMTFLRSL